MLIGLSPGTERALWLTGLTTGAFHNVVGSNIVVFLEAILSLGYRRVEVEKCLKSFGKKAGREKRKYLYGERPPRWRVERVSRLDGRSPFSGIITCHTPESDDMSAD